MKINCVTVAILSLAVISGCHREHNADTPTLQLFSIDQDTDTVGARITLKGSGFSTTAFSDRVVFNDVTATTADKAWADSIQVIVPSGATTGKISVEAGGRKAYTPTVFNVVTGRWLQRATLPLPRLNA